MFESFNQATDGERAMLRKLRVWIVALAAVCVLTGIGVGALLTGHPAVAQDGGLPSARAPEALSASFAEIAKRAESAVVNIDTLSAPEVAEKDNDDKDDQSSNNPFFDTLRRRALRPSRGVGSGFIIDPKGYILTNQHVIDGATRIMIALGDGERFRARVVGVDQETDLAVIKVEAGRDLPTIKFGDSTAAQVGDWVLAIGSPFGLDQTVTAGIISKQDREPQSASQFQRFMQTDAAINRGNSGGPLLNMRGEAIGVNSQIATLAGEYSGIGFALPSNEAKSVYEQIVANGKVRRGYLGVTLETVHNEFAKVYALPEARGAIVVDVLAESAGQPTPAARAGLQTNDVIVEFNGQPIQDAQGLIAKVAGSSVGQAVPMVFLRDADGKPDRHTASMIIAERPALASADPEVRAKDPKPSTAKGNTIHLGLTLAELTPQLITERHLVGVKGLWVKDVDINGVAADARPAGVSEGDVVTRINRVAVTTIADFTRVVSSLKPGDPVVINLSRREGPGITQRIVQFTYQ